MQRKKKINIFLVISLLLISEFFVPTNLTFAGMPWEQTFNVSGGDCGWWYLYCSRYGYAWCTNSVVFNTRIRNPSYQVISIQGGTLSSVNWLYDRDGLVYGATIRVKADCVIREGYTQGWGFLTTCVPCNCGECYSYGYRGCWRTWGYFRWCTPCTCSTYTLQSYLLQIKFLGTGPSPDDPFAGYGANTRVCTGAVNSSQNTVIFNWNVTGRPQNAFWLQVDNDSNFSSLEYDSGIISSSTNSHTISLPEGNYYWRIAVRSSGSFYYWTPWAYGDSFTVVSNRPPSATNLRVTQPDYCISAPGAIFSWQFTDPDQQYIQSAYQVQVDDNHDFSSPEVDSGKVYSSSNSYGTPHGALSYNTTYYWRLKVWDSLDAESSWILGPSFTTPRHPYPTADFTWSPQTFFVNQIVQFTDQSQAFGGATIVSWFWSFQDGVPPTSNEQNPKVRFVSPGEKTVTLSVEDSDGYGPCTTTKTINIRKPLPKWELLKRSILRFFADLIKLKKELFTFFQ